MPKVRRSRGRQQLVQDISTANNNYAILTVIGTVGFADAEYVLEQGSLL